MKLYHSLDVELTYQNQGTSWLGILRGPTDHITLAFNGLYNLCATHGRMQFRDHLQMVATFWTERNAMRRFFFNQFYLPRVSGKRGQGRLIRLAMRQAHHNLNVLTSTSHEFFQDFSANYMVEIYGNGYIKAERPDTDAKDAILAHAFADKRD